MPEKPTPRTASVSVDAIMPGMMSAEDKRRQMKYMAEDAVRSLTRADEIRKDASLMKAVKNHSKEQIKTLQKVCK